MRHGLSYTIHSSNSRTVYFAPFDHTPVITHSMTVTREIARPRHEHAPCTLQRSYLPCSQHALSKNACQSSLDADI